MIKRNKKVILYILFICLITAISIVAIGDKETEQELSHAKKEEVKKETINKDNRKKIKIYIAGGSSAKSYDIESIYVGWGQLLYKFFDTDKVNIINKAEKGKSSKSFIKEGRLAEIEKEIKEGDYLFVSFGHNDMRSDKKVHTNPDTDFKIYLREYVRCARKKGAVPVLITPLARGFFKEDDETVKNYLKPYAVATQEVAIEMDVPLIELNKYSKRLYELVGKRYTQNVLFIGYDSEKIKQDLYHYKYQGAFRCAKIIAEQLKKEVPQLKEYILV